MNRIVAAIAGTLLLSSTGADAEIRTWTDATGKFKIEAEFVSLDEQTLSLRSAGGKVKKIEMGKLCPADRIVAGELAKLARIFPLDRPATQDECIAAIEELGGKVVLEPRVAVILKRGRISDLGLMCLAGLDGLQVLDVSFTPISDAGVQRIAGISTLEDLDLSGTRVTDEGLGHLKGLKNLRGLRLGITEIGDPGIFHLKGMNRLQTLDLTMTKITDTGLAQLASLTELTELNLYRTTVTDSAMSAVGKLTNLKTLNLTQTGVSDAGLANLEGLRKLEELKLLRSKVTELGRSKFKSALPECEIDP